MKLFRKAALLLLILALTLSTAVTASAAPPETPAIKIDIHTASGQPMLWWEPVPGAAKYEVWRTDGVGAEDARYTLMSTQTATTYTNLVAVPGGAYTYRVRALFPGNSDADSAFCPDVYLHP